MLYSQEKNKKKTKNIFRIAYKHPFYRANESRMNTFWPNIKKTEILNHRKQTVLSIKLSAYNIIISDFLFLWFNIFLFSRLGCSMLKT